ncbi:MAG: hypothetical protein EYC62_08995 [Alphaproteobacteria bacterium]|nr:MAG: hypothetical protein EYC62_08995 [Alphaproteobacteria bacterium]
MASNLTDTLYTELEEDDIGLWVIPWHLERVGIPKSNQLQETKKIVYELLNKGARFGQFIENNGNKEFVVWKLSTTEIIDKIESEWKKANRAPEIGEIGWLSK